MRFLHTLFAIASLAGCSADKDDSIVGTWSVTENLSNQVYEIDFRPDGTLEQTVASETSIGRYTVASNSGHLDLLITWRNGSEAAIWARRIGPESMEFYDDTGVETPDFDSAFLLGTLKKMD